MFRWAAIPFVRITASLIAGILIGHEHGYLSIVIPIAIVTFMASLWISGTSVKFIRGTALLVVVSIIGYKTHDMAVPRLSDERLLVSDGYFATIDSYCSSARNTKAMTVHIYAFVKDSIVYPASDLCQIYLTDSLSPTLYYGDVIFISGHPQTITSARNPNAFDFSKYMSNKGILLQQWVNEHDMILTNLSKGNPILNAAYSLRNQFEDIIIQNITSHSEKSLALALLLGIKDELDSETRTSFANAGAMHVLAVSGLHVGIIYLIISSVLKYLQVGVVKKWLSPALSILVIWLYAIMAGFSPSILRAALMFTLLITAKSIGTKTSTINSIAVSAFILLVHNPLYIFDIGFQLSYAAIIGILVLYNPLHQHLSPKSWIGQQLWSLVSLSVVAQLATTPISLYYFHQFPTLFLFSNVVVFVLIYPVMVVGIGLLFLNDTFAGDLLALVFRNLLWLLNQGINLVGQHDHLVWKAPWISFHQMIFLYLIIITLIIWLWSRKIRWVWISAFFISLCTSQAMIRLHDASQQRKIIFYSDRKSGYIDKIEGLSVQLYNYNKESYPSFVSHQVLPNRRAEALPSDTTCYSIRQPANELCTGVHGCYIHGKRILFVGTSNLNHVENRIETDILVLNKDATKGFDQIEDKLEYKLIILDNTVSDWYSKKITNRHKNVVLLREGAYTLQ